MSLTAKSVYIPLLLHQGGAEIFPSIRRLAAMAGIGVKAAGGGLAQLERLGHITRKANVTRDGNQGYSYTIIDPANANKKENFPVKASIVYAGHWAQLPTIAQALYIAIRANATYDNEAHEDHGNEKLATIGEDFLVRDWEHCEMYASDLCTLAGIARCGFAKASAALVAQGLLEPEYDRKGWRVRLHAEAIIATSEVNALTAKRYPKRERKESVCLRHVGSAV